jgi:hypothetical protein
LRNECIRLSSRCAGARRFAGALALDGNIPYRSPPEPTEVASIPATDLVTTMENSFTTAIDAFTKAHGAEAMAKFPEIAHFHATR